MIKYLGYLIVLPFLTFKLGFAQSYSIKFIVISNSVPDTGNVYISGNNDLLGKWNPGKIKLNRVNDSTWTKSFLFPKGNLLEYKFTKGSWQEEALTNKGYIPSNYKLKVNRDTTILVKILKWKDQSKITNGFEGKITGKVRYFKNITGNGIKPRDVVVWLPPGYDADTLNHYPVLYMQDGQNLFDPETSAFGIDWQADETTDSLIRNNIISPIIIVGVYNTIDRSQEYTPTKKGMAYMKFIATKLKPFIDSTFRTLPGREYTSAGGSSYGGTISFMLAWYYPGIFSKAACFSPAFKTGKFDLTTVVKNYRKDEKEIEFYFDNGGAGLDKKLQPGIDKMINALKGKGFKLNKNIFWFKDSTAKHFEADWAKRFWRPLKIFFDTQNLNKKKKIKQRYKLSKRFRIQSTFANTYAGIKNIANIPFLLSLNYRNSSVDSLDLENLITLSFTKEPGFNIGFYPELFLFAYFKIGPEIRIKKYFYTDFHIGLGIFATNISNKFGLAPVPFWGAEIGYIHKFFHNYLFEIEAGVNKLPWNYSKELYYISIGFSF